MREVWKQNRQRGPERQREEDGVGEARLHNSSPTNAENAIIIWNLKNMWSNSIM